MIITSGSHTINDEGADLFDAGKLAGRAHIGSALADRVWRISQSLEDESKRRRRKEKAINFFFFREIGAYLKAYEQLGVEGHPAHFPLGW